MAIVKEEAEWLDRLAEANGYKEARAATQGRWAAIYPFLFSYAILTGQMFDDTGYDDRWCYHMHYLAKAALDEWAKRGFDGEPIGWHRHPFSGRRRPDGDPEKEFTYP